MEKRLILSCDKLCKNFGKKKILKNVSLELYEGDILGFIGPNGAGKTTTIKLILGLQSIGAGNVMINGYDIKKDFVKAINRVGAIVENPDMYMYLSGYDNLKLVAKMYNIDKKRIDEVVKLVGLEKRINDKVSKYSLGMRQRLGIAAAILPNPNLLILDEPTNGLDPEGIKEIRELLTRLAKDNGMAVLISSHILSELESFCTKVCIIQNGKVVETNDLKDIKHNTKDTCYIIELDDVKKFDFEFEKISDFKIRIHADRKEIPEYINKLLEKKVAIYGIYEEEDSLEDAFLKRTGGNVIE